MRYFRYLLAFTFLLFSFAALAHNDVTNYNQISLDAAASADVENDTMIVSLYAQEEGSEAAKLSQLVNTKINHALEKLEHYKSIKVATESYSTNPVYSKDKIIGWRVRQSIRLESQVMPVLSEVLGGLQKELQLSSISFDISREKTEQQTGLLINQALAAYNQRATQIAKQLDHYSFKIVDMRVTTSTNAVPYRFKAASAVMAEAAPAVSPDVAKGEKTLSVRVSGTIELD